MRPIGEVGASQFLPLIAMSLRVLATLLLGVAFLLGGGECAALLDCSQHLANE